MLRQPNTSPNTAVQICRQKARDATLVVAEDTEQNEYLAGKLAFDDMEFLVLGCKITDLQGQWRCQKKDQSSWYWYNETIYEGYWSE